MAVAMEGLSVAETTPSQLFARLMPGNPVMRKHQKRVEHLQDTAPPGPPAPTLANTPESSSSGGEQAQLTYEDILKMLNTPSPGPNPATLPYGMNGNSLPLNNNTDIGLSEHSSHSSTEPPLDVDSGFNHSLPTSRQRSPHNQSGPEAYGSFNAPLYPDSSDGSAELSHPGTNRNSSSQCIPNNHMTTTFERGSQSHTPEITSSALAATLGQDPINLMGIPARSSVPMSASGYAELEEMSRRSSFNNASLASNASLPLEAGPSRPGSSQTSSSRPNSSMMHSKQQYLTAGGLLQPSVQPECHPQAFYPKGPTDSATATYQPFDNKYIPNAPLNPASSWANDFAAQTVLYSSETALPGQINFNNVETQSCLPAVQLNKGTSFPMSQESAATIGGPARMGAELDPLSAVGELRQADYEALERFLQGLG